MSRRARRAEARLALAAQPLAWPLAALLARRGGSLRVPLVGTVVADLALGRAILRDDAAFPKNGRRSLAGQMTQVLGPRALLNVDGTDHRALRRAVAPAFAPARVERLAEGVAGAAAAELAAELAAGRDVDVVAVTAVLSGRLTFALLGVAPPAAADAARVAALAERLVAHGNSRGSELGPQAEQAARAVRDELVRLLRQGEAVDDDGAVARVRRLALAPDDEAGLLAALAMAGTQTLVVGLPRIVALVLDGELLDALRARPELVAGTVDEGFRLTTPLPATVRVAARDVEVEGRRFAAGDRVLVLTYAAARSRQSFPAPTTLDPTRELPPAARGVAFGSGPHTCPGALLARRTAEHVVAALVTAPGRPRVMRRRARRRGLLPAYAELVIGRVA